ncbi:MAG: DUF4358 domain-containing protein [Ruthenibacterium sp.]
MKRLFAGILTAALVLSLAACGAKPAASSSTAPAAPKDYVQILKDARTDEFNESYPILSGTSADDATLGHNPFDVPAEEGKNMYDMVVEMTGFKPELMTQYAMSVSLMNVQVYTVGIFKPADGKTQDVIDAANGYVEMQKKAQEQYLADQYAIAKAAIVKELPSGEVILVMCENANDVAAKIETALK